MSHSSHSSDILSDGEAHIHPSWLSVLPQREKPTFRVFRQLNHLDEVEGISARELCSLKARVTEDKMSFFSGEHLPNQVVRVIIENRLMDLKEVIESFEFFQRVRRRISQRVIADLCCGHGLVGMLFALLERRVEEVYLLDLEHPTSSYKLEHAFNQRWPWVSPKLNRLTRNVKGAAESLPESLGVVAVHACGARTDWAIQVAVYKNAPLAVMPCCYAHQSYQGPETLKRHLGVNLCVDLERIQSLHRLGYQVDWLEIPPEITPKNRIIAASPPRSS